VADRVTHSDDDLHRNRARAESFGQRAELYDRTRPRYPDALIDDLLEPAARGVLDVGCGTGLLGRSFVERGIPVLGVEPDAQMAAVARTHGLDVEVGTFEAWEPGGRTVGLLVAGQAWHWVDPVAGARKAAAVVSPGGTVAHAWNVGSFDDDLYDALGDVYRRYAPGEAYPLVPHRRDLAEGPTASERAFAETGAFDEAVHAAYPWAHRYTTEAWLAQLETHSDHALMAPEARATLLAAVGSVIDSSGGSFTMHYVCEVVRHRRR
jgi:SAM-dependent methyltransferase